MSGNTYDPKKVCAHNIRGTCRYGKMCNNIHVDPKVFFRGATMSHNLQARGGDPRNIGINDEGFALTRQQQLDAVERIQQTPGFQNFQAKNMDLWDIQELIEAELADIDKMIAEEEAKQAEEDEEDEENAEYLKVATAWYEEQQALRIVEEAFAGVGVVDATNAAALSCYGPPAGRSDNTPTCSGIPTKEELAPSVAALFTNAAAVPPKTPTYAMAAMKKVPSAPKKEPKPVKQPIWGFDGNGNCVMPLLPVDGEWGNAK